MAIVMFGVSAPCTCRAVHGSIRKMYVPIFPSITLLGTFVFVFYTYHGETISTPTVSGLRGTPFGITQFLI